MTSTADARLRRDARTSSFDRRELFAGGGGMLICTLAGQKVLKGEPADVERLAVGGRRCRRRSPPRAAGETTLVSAPPSLARVDGAVREYWIRAEQVRWNIVPTGRDGMMDKKIKGKTKFTAYAYRAYTPGFAEPLGTASIPGPLLECEEGETIVVNFQNRLPAQVTMHPHGIFYSQEMDGAYKGRHTDPGGFVQKNQTFRYVWDARPGTAGAWMYHDHGPLDPIPALQGPVRAADHPQAGRAAARPRGAAVHAHVQPGGDRPQAAVLVLQRPRLRRQLADDQRRRRPAGRAATSTRSTTTSTPSTSTGTGGRTRAARSIDNQTLGPGDATTVAFVEDNPGRWFYHCHVFTHLHAGMNGWYLVS